MEHNVSSLQNIENAVKKEYFLDNKDKINRLLNRTNIKDRLINALSPGYSKKKEIIIDGFYTWGFVSNISYLQEDELIVKVLFSPQESYLSSPEGLQQINDNINALENKKRLSRKEKKLMMQLTSLEEEPYYFQVDDSFTNGDVVYVTTLFIDPDLMKNEFLTDKIIPIIFNKKIYKEIIYINSEYYK